MKKFLIVGAIILSFCLTGVSYGAVKTILQLTEETAPTSDDLVHLWEVTGGTSRKVTLENLGKGITIPNISQISDILASASEINTPLDGALVTLTEFRELETIGATTISANQWALLGALAETLTAAEINILDGVTGVTAAELSYIGDVTGLIQAQIDLKAPLDDPTFTTAITIGSADISEAELEHIDGMTTTAARLNYLTSAGGTTGTTSTNIVFSTSPTLVTPTLGAATATSITLNAAANPAYIWRDSDGADTDKTVGDAGAGFSDGTSGAEISDWQVGHLGSGTAGTHYTHLFWDGSDAHLYMGVLANYTGANPSVAPLDVGTYESLVWDFDYGTDTVGVTSPVSGTTTIDFTTLHRIGTGSLAGRPVITSAGSERALTAAECSGGIVLVTAAVEVQLPDVCDSATGAFVMIVQADASEVIQIAVTDTNDKLYLDGADLGANQEIDSPGAAVEDDYIVLLCREANEWHQYGKAGTWVDGGAAD